MALMVKKFGGSSLANADRISHVADLIIGDYKKGHQVVVVVSAMFGETDRLIAFSKLLQDNPNLREYAVLVTAGEQIAISLLSMALLSKGVNAKSYTGGQVKILTDDCYEKARILDVNCDNIKQDITNGNIVVIAGFQGISKRGDITTLGRGGSDTTAVAISAALKADECVLYTDVDGVYTADPKVVDSAIKLSTIHFEEMLVLSHCGAKVIQPRAVELAGKFKMPIKVSSSFTLGEGTTIIHNNDNFESPLVRAVTFSKNISKVTIDGIKNDSVSIGATLCLLSETGLQFDMVNYYPLDADKLTLSFIINTANYPKILSIIEQDIAKINAKGISSNDSLAILSLVGLGLRGHSSMDILQKIFKVLNKNGINIHMLSTGDIKISLLLDENNIENGVQIIHKELFLN